MNRVKTIALILLLSVSSMSGVANAMPITADIENFSVIHMGSNPAGTGDRDDWFNFDEGQTLDLDFDMNTNLIELIAPQTFSLNTTNGQVAVLQLLGFSMDLNDTDGFLGGSIEYVLNGMAGIFSFGNENHGSTFYNSSTLNGGVFNLYIWGGDDANDLGLDMGLTAQVPEPSALMLVLIGLAAFRLSKKMS